LYKIDYLQIFQAGYFYLQIKKQIAVVFKQNYNHVFSLPSTTCQHHLEKRAANV